MHEHSHENRERTEAPLPDAHAVAALLDVHPSWVYAERAGRLRTVSPCAAAARSLSADGGAMARAAGVIA